MKPENFEFITQYLTPENFNNMLQMFISASTATATAATNLFNHMCPLMYTQPSKPNQPAQNSQFPQTNSSGPAQNCHQNPGANFGSLFQNLMTPQNLLFVSQMCTPQNLSYLANLSAAFQPRDVRNPQNNVPENSSPIPCKNSTQNTSPTSAQNTWQNSMPNTCKNSAQNDPHNPFGALFQNLMTPQNLAYVQQNLSDAASMLSKGIKTTLNQIPKPVQNPTQIPVQTPQIPVQTPEIPVQTPAQTPVQTTVEIPVQVQNPMQKEETPADSELFRPQVQAMTDMGFTNAHLNEEILRKFNGNLDQAIQFIIDVSF